MQLESLTLPEADAAEEAGQLLMNLSGLWSSANLEKRRALLLPMLDAVYVDTKEAKAIVAIQPKAPLDAPRKKKGAMLKPMAAPTIIAESVSSSTNHPRTTRSPIIPMELKKVDSQRKRKSLYWKADALITFLTLDVPRIQHSKRILPVVEKHTANE